MSKEPKSPKGEKASEKYWNNSYMGPNGKYFFEKAPFVKLVSLEAKIEELENLYKWEFITNEFYQFRTKELQSEYSELLKEHNL
jgi:hypothetical protein